ncbi:hypothetical protein [Priestia flexa]|uniref:restriction endonuclease n=1 Tax=Priestia flexa TaxID=86664 RepID=UPI0034D97F4A
MFVSWGCRTANVDTKGSTYQEELYLIESGKITCGRKHFAAIENGVKYKLANSYEKFKKEFWLA